MRIALIIYGTLDTVSGGYLYDRLLAAHLRHKGHTVDVISLPWRGYAAHLLQNAAPQLRSTHGYDLILQDELNHPSLFAFNRRFKRQHPNTPLVAIVHHLRISEKHPAWVMPLYRGVERAYLRSVDAFILNSNTTRQAVEQLIQSPTHHVIGYPAGNRLPITVTSQQVYARSHSKDLRLLFVGNVIPRKGVHTIIEALAKLPFDEWQLSLVAGPNSDDAYVRVLRGKIDAHGLGSRVIWHHNPTDNVLADLYSSHHVFVMPSQYEGFGIVYLEAMSAGLVVIGSTAGAAGEFITQGHNGYLVRPNGPTTLADHITALHTDRNLLQRISTQARSTFDAHPSWEDTMETIGSFLTQVAGGASNG